MEQLADRVTWAIVRISQDENLSDEELAKIIGTNKNTLAAYRNKEGLIKGGVLTGLIRHFNYNSILAPESHSQIANCRMRVSY